MAKKARERKPRQQPLPGTEDSKIQALETAAQDYAEIRDQRMELNTDEAKLKAKLLSLMKQHEKTTYKRGGIEIKLVSEEEHVKVRIKKPTNEDEFGTEGDN